MKNTLLIRFASLCALGMALTVVAAGYSFYRNSNDGLIASLAAFSILAVVVFPVFLSLPTPDSPRGSLILAAFGVGGALLVPYGIALPGDGAPLQIGFAVQAAVLVIAGVRCWRGAGARTLGILSICSGTLMAVVAIGSGEAEPFFYDIAVYALSLAVGPLWLGTLALFLATQGEKLSRRTVRRLVIAVGTVVIVTSAIWLGLTIRNGRILDAEIARLDASGAMTRLEQLTASIPEAAGDAAGQQVVDFFFELQPEMFDAPVKVGDVTICNEYLAIERDTLLAQWSPEIAAGVREALERNAALLAQLEDMAQRPPAKPGTWVAKAMEGAEMLVAYKLPNLLAVRGSANLLSLKAILAAQEGRPDEILACASAILGLASHMNDAGDTMIHEMFVAALRSIAADLVIELGNGMNFSDGQRKHFDEISRQSAVLDEITKALEFERLSIMDVFRQTRLTDWISLMTDSPQGQAVFATYDLPIFGFLRNHDETVWIHTMNQFVEASKLPAREADSAIEKLVSEFGSVKDFLSPVTVMTIPNLYRSFTHHRNSIALLSSVRIGLAVQQYHQAHGAYPASLDGLVPNYLDAVPLDPYTDEPFIYRPADQGFAVYSLGPNFEDDGGHSYKNDGGDGDIGWGLSDERQ